MRSFKPALLGFCAAGALFSGLVNAAFAGDKLLQAPAPDWVKPTAPPAAPQAATASDAPLTVLVSDVQAKFSADGSSSFYTAVSMRIDNARGLSAGQFSLAWDPATDDITVHSFRILRGDKVIDVLATQTFTVVRRETNLDMAMLDGVLTGVLQPEGLQVGDILTYAYTRTRRIPALGTHVEGFLYDGLTIPTSHYVRRAIWDKNVSMLWKASGDLTGVKFTHTASGSEVLFDASDYVPPKAVDDSPTRDQAFGQIEFSDYRNWSDLSAALDPLYEKAVKLASGSPLHAEADKIRAASADPVEQAALALQLVEGQVRYVFLGMNQSGIIPADADTTWTRRFGDCKGKSVLLTALLRELGVKAEPVLVSTGLGDGLDQRLPQADYFDHVIVRAEIGGKVYWLDGTRYGDRRLADLRVPDFHWVLPLRAGGAALEELKPVPLDAPGSETLLQLDASAGLDVPARAHAERIFRGDDAVQLNASLSAMTEQDRDKALKSSWTDDYDWLAPSSVSASFDPDKREERFVVDGDAKMDWDTTSFGQGRRYEADGYGLGWTSELKRDPGPHQNDPVTVNYPIYTLNRETIILPNKGKDFSMIGEPVDKTLYGMTFHRALTLKDGVFTMEASVRSLVPEIAYADAIKAQPELKTMARGGVYVVAPFSYKATQDELAASKPVDGDAATHKNRAMELMGKGQKDAALIELDAAIKLKPDDTELLMMRGGAREINRDFAGALADFDAVLKLDPLNWEALNGRGSALLTLKRPAEAIDAYSQSLELHSDNDWARSGRIEAYQANKQPEKALTDAQVFARLKPDLPHAQRMLAEALFANKKYAEAYDAFRKVLAMTPDDISLMSEFADRLTPCYDTTSSEACQKEHDEALALYDKVIAVEPSAYAYTARSQARHFDQFDLKKQDIDAALGMEPDNSFALTSRASLYLSHKDYDLAIADATHVIEHPDPDFDNFQAYQIRAYAYEQQKKYDLELSDWDKLVQLEPDHAAWLNNRAWMRATHDIEPQKALDDINAALKMMPDTPSYLDTRGFTELRLGQLDAAMTDYDQALKLAPGLADSLYGRGLVKLRKGMTKDGKADLDAARKISPDIDKTFAGYGMTP